MQLVLQVQMLPAVFNWSSHRSWRKRVSSIELYLLYCTFHFPPFHRAVPLHREHEYAVTIFKGSLVQYILSEQVSPVVWLCKWSDKTAYHSFGLVCAYVLIYNPTCVNTLFFFLGGNIHQVMFSKHLIIQLPSLELELCRLILHEVKWLFLPVHAFEESQEGAFHWKLHHKVSHLLCYWSCRSFVYSL